MGNGFKRFTGFTPLALKNLNDQLEQLWLKVMGGIRFRDLDAGTQNIINSKLDEAGVQSIVRQSQDEIVMAVGSGGGDNLVRNGDFAFDFDSWSVNNTVISGEYAKINGSYILQVGIRVEQGRIYSFGVEGYGNSGAVISVFGQYSGDNADAESVLLGKIETQSASEAKKERGSFSVPTNVVSCSLKIQSDGVYYVRKIFVREGNNVGEYTSNPNELVGSGITINEESVNISTPKFSLEIVDSDGKVKSIMTAEGNGFDTIQSQNVSIMGRRVADSRYYEIYVNSSQGNDSNDGLSTYTPFKTIGRALKALAYNLYETNTIHLSGGTYYEDIIFNYGGVGTIQIKGEDATLYGCFKVRGTAQTIYMTGLKIYSNNEYGVYAYGAVGYLDMANCLIDCNSLKGSMGIYLYFGARMYVRECEINNCDTAIKCYRGSYLNIYELTGKNNNLGIDVNNLATVNVYGTVPMGKVISKEGTSGTITGTMYGTKAGVNYQSPRDAVKKLSVNPTKKFSYVDGKAVSGVLRQGKGKAAVLVFDVTNIKNTLSGKTIKSVKLTVMRSSTDANTQVGTLKLYSHNIASESGAFSYVNSYGDVCEIKRGEKVSFDLPLEVLSKIINGYVRGVMFYDNSDNNKYSFDLLTANPAPVLEVLYV